MLMEFFALYFTYTLMGTELLVINQVRHFGIAVNSSMKMSTQHTVTVNIKIV